MFKHIKDNKGFTLIELMIVIAVIGILAAIAVPSFNTYRDKAKITGADAVLSGVYTEVKVSETDGEIFFLDNEVCTERDTTPTNCKTAKDLANDTLGTNKIEPPNGYSAVGFKKSYVASESGDVDPGSACTYPSTGNWKIGAKASNATNRYVDNTKKFSNGGTNTCD